MYDRRGRLVDDESLSPGWSDRTAVFRPRTQAPTVARIRQSQSSVYVPRRGTLFSGTGVFDGIAWSPDGDWLLVVWPTADQWVFVRAHGARRIEAVSNVSEQFRSHSPPRIEGWSK
jgi:sugar lactone lactonase YvrE